MKKSGFPPFTRHLSLVTLLAFTLTTLFDAGTLAYAFTPVGSGGTGSGNQSSQLGQISESAGPVQSFQTDLFTGRAQTSVPIFVPPGRKNIQPALNLSYSSSGANSWLGAGWALDLGFIQRDLKKGVPKYSAVGAAPAGGDSTDKFTFSFQGVNSELTLVAPNEYRARDEALFLKFIYDPAANSWTVTDKSGTKYYFGLDANCRQTNSLGTFKWAISKVKDTLGNTMSVMHAQDAGEMYLSGIDYNSNETQAFSATHQVLFTLEDRPDKTFSYITGVRTDLNKRLKEINVKVKDSAGVYQLARKYALTYEISAGSSRSRLKTVTEYGRDGVTALPAVTFTYQDKALSFNPLSDFSGIQRASNSSDYDFIRKTNTSGQTLVDFMDINGDARPDRVQAVAGNTNWKVQLNTGTSFGALTDFGPLSKPTGSSDWDWITKSGSSGEMAADLADLNGDGLVDRIMAQTGNTSWQVQMSNGSGLNAVTSWPGLQNLRGTFPYDYPRYTLTTQTGSGTTYTRTFADLVDMNGDGLPDRVMADDTAMNTSWKVQMSNGSGFSPMQDWGPVENRYPATNQFTAIRFTDTGNQTNVDLMDLNGDGLPDRVQALASQSLWKVQWNTGRGFTSMQDFGPVQSIGPAEYSGTRYCAHLSITPTPNDSTSTGEQIAGMLDLNGDGLADRVESNGTSTWNVQYNTGEGFANEQAYQGTIDSLSTEIKYKQIRWQDGAGGGMLYLDATDIDGDGIVDRVESLSGNTSWKIQSGKGPYPDLLSVIDNGRGGKTTVTYSPSTSFDNVDTTGKHRLPFPIQVVTQVIQEDGMGPSTGSGQGPSTGSGFHEYITNYSYKGGMYDSVDREFRGFREVTVTDAAGTKTISTFGQDDHNKGKQLQKEVWGASVLDPQSSVLYTKEVTTWSDTHPWGESVDVHFVFVSLQDNYLYDGDSSYQQTQQTFTYDSYGNLASTIEKGDMSVTGDERKTTNTYVYNSTDYIVNTLAKTTLFSGSGFVNRESERYFYYDNAASINTAPTKGLLTAEQEWLNTCQGPAPDLSPLTCHPVTKITYDSFGNVATVTDARGYITTNTYETTYRLFLTQIKNALNHTRQFTYDPWIAQILTSTDQNSQVTTTNYDALGRVTKVISPLDSATEPTQEFAYEYPVANCTTCVTKTTTKVKSSVPGQTFTQLITYSFTDGLGREIQRRSPAEDPMKQIVTGIVTFDNRGQVRKQYVPSFENSSPNYQIFSDSELGARPSAQFTYDALGRRTHIDYPDGTFSTVAFSDFVKTTTDQRGKQLRYTNDAYGRLVKVEEFSAGSTYTTTYEYDVLNNLKKTTDNAYNLTLIAYDSLSRKTSMTDPDMGVWSYAYDKNDNLTSQTDAKSQTISFTYDALNRVTLKNLPTGETDVTYNYDSAPSGYTGQTGYWTGRLAKVTDASGTHEFLYDKHGRVLKDKKTVNSVAYEFVRAYDAMGRVRTLTYPDTEVVTYGYNNFGDVETIQGNKNSVITDYIKDVNYNASGQITFTKYGNNVTSDYTYNANTLRLSNILTKKPDGTTKLQDLSYTFDNNGNVAQISDIVNSMSQTFTYDDLNRLLTATGSAYGTQTFQYDPIGNMTKKGNLDMTYGATGGTKPHAVTAVTSSSKPTYCDATTSDLTTCTMTYDANGNMITRGFDTLQYDSENRLKQVTSDEGVSGTQAYTLQPGWNLISFPYLPANKSISSVLSPLIFGTDYDQISYYDPAAASWKHFVNDPDFNDFTTFEYGKSYEIYNKKSTAVTFTVTGKSRATDVNFQIKVGENFVSPGVKASTSVSSLLSQWGLTIGMQISNIKRMNSSGALESYAAGQFTTFEPGKGYIFYGLANSSFNYGKTETVTTFVYDSTGARVKKITAPSAGSGQATSTSIYLGKDYDVSGSLTSKYIFLGDRRISMKDSSGALLFYHEDHINSSNVITDASGNRAALYEYDPYGSTVTQTGTVTVKHRFTSQEADDSTRLYHYGGRYYDPQLGRFITADPTIQHPTDPQDFNRYAYARNNPILYNDPTGFGFWKSLFRFFTKVYSAVMGGVTAAVVFAATGDRHLAAGLGVAVYRGLDARLNGASWAESLRAAARGYYEGVSLVNGDRGAAISIIVNNPDTGPITQSEVKAGAKQNQSALSELAGLTLVAAAIIATRIEGTTAQHSASPELAKSASATNQLHFRILSRPPFDNPFGFKHLIAFNDETAETIELRNINWTNRIMRSRDQTIYNTQYIGKMQGALHITVNRDQFEAAFSRAKERFHGKAYSLGASNSFMIELFAEAGRPFSEKEKKKLGIDNTFGILACYFILPPPYAQRLDAAKRFSSSEHTPASFWHKMFFCPIFLNFRDKDGN